jgi:hypothetical protein
MAQMAKFKRDMETAVERVCESVEAANLSTWRDS